MTEINHMAFACCTSLTSINIPDTVETIVHSSFSTCRSLTLIVIPQSVTLERGDRFKNCDSLQKRQVNGLNNHPDTATWLRQRFDDLPLHQVFYYSTNDMTTTLLTNLIHQYTSTMLASTDAMFMTPSHVLCCNPSVTLEMIRMLKATCPDAASMTNVLGETLIMMYLKSNSQEYDAYHANGQLFSLVHLLELGVPYEILDVICTLYD
jgi:acetylglutamate synthase